MPNQYYCVLLAFLVCAALLPAVKRLARRFHLFDPPGPLKIHSGPIARLGGIAMAAGLLASSGVFLPLTSWKTVMFLFVFSTVWTVGLVDDVRGLPSYFRFCIQMAAGASFWFAGWHLGWFGTPLLDLGATCLFVALVINAFNLLDGMDGLAASMGLLISMGFLMLSARASDATEAIMAASLLGVCAGVLTANAPPATIFMGDSGSTLIGVVLAFLSLNWVRIEPANHSMIVPLIFLGIPLADVVLAVLRRARRRARLFDGDRSHYYDILLRRRWTVGRVLEVSLGATCALVLAGWLSARGILSAGLAAGITLAGLAGAAYFLGSLQLESKPTRNNQQGTSLGSALD